MSDSTNQEIAGGSFTGPIFIVGMPRSGTKLLRSLLNNHSAIGITVNESGYLPYFYHNFANYEPIQVRENFSRFFHDFSETTFFQRLTDNNPFIDEERWYAEIKTWSYAGVIEAFYRYYAKSENKKIWGDKTPSYMLEMPLLKSLFPTAKFIHIIRDVRDYSLSINKAWNKNILRASQRWNDAINRSRKDAQSLPQSDYMEVRFEELVSSPQVVLPKICDYLGIAIEQNLAHLDKPSENLGDAKGSAEIVKDNYGKWKGKMKEAQITKIERICHPLLSQLGYPTADYKDSLRLGKTEMRWYKILDGLNFLLFEIKTNKYQGVVNFFKSRKIERKV